MNEKKTLLIQAVSKNPWIGGIYYRKNIIFSLLQNEKFKNHFNVILLIDANYEKDFADFHEEIKLQICNSLNILYVSAKLFFCIMKYRVKFIFPFINLKFLKYMKITPISWIYDFQHLYYPTYFSEKEIRRRNLLFSKIANDNNPLIVSSNCAKNDLLNYFNPSRQKLYVVHFISYIENELNKLTLSREGEILQKYGIEANRYICISNQFWQHKNHKAVFEAIRIMSRKKYEFPLFVFTGVLSDRRNASYIKELEIIMEDELVKPHIKVLGFIEREEQLAIIKNALFLIQPSLFEGWGTFLEEAKVMDKWVILSDIPVHKEQMSSKCILYNAESSEDLSLKIIGYLTSDYETLSSLNIEKMRRDALAYSHDFMHLLTDED
ncbi:MAG: glycosyltransferase [Lachnospiraceae bacterium]|nr:glycosyltransferase [Lachnospiraceae bacterium]